MLKADDNNRFCCACRYNRLLPDAETAEGLERWRRISQAQRHMFYGFLKWDLPCPGRDIDPEGGLVFDFLEDERLPDGTCKQAIIGHDEGVISIRAAEADDEIREIIRTQMGEPYRTLLGHFRHEIGHFIWNKMVRDEGRLEAFRAIFGDERIDYEEALKSHYKDEAQGKDGDYISHYASTHPWEDFAETFAHCLHIVDALESAHSFGISLRPKGGAIVAPDLDYDPYQVADFDQLVDTWIPLSVALNTIHNAMGERPLYPFILSPKVRTKLSFVHRLITRRL
jgi:hypothetical protein